MPNLPIPVYRARLPRVLYFFLLFVSAFGKESKKNLASKTPEPSPLGEGRGEGDSFTSDVRKT